MALALSPITKVVFFWSRFFLKYSIFLSIQEVLLGLVDLRQDGAGALSLSGFAFLGLDSLIWGFLAIVSWVCIFKAVEVVLEGLWPLRQWISKSQTLILDLRPVLASALTVYYIISSKLIDYWSCCSILTLIESLMFF